MKRQLKSALLILVMVMLVSASLVGCSKPTTDPVSKVLTIATPYTIDTLNPFMYSSDGDRYVLSQVVEALVDGTAGAYYPLLAESWSNPDDLTWDFVIRENAHWHTGNSVYPEGEKVQLTAADVKDVWQWVLDPNNKARQQPTLAEIVEKVELVSDNTVRFTTKEPSAFFLQHINRVPIFSLKALEVLGRDGFDKFPIGTGPFKFVEYKTDDKVRLARNDDYHIKPNLEEVVFQIIPDTSVSAIALRTGEVDIALQVPASEVESVAKEEKLKVVPNVNGWYRYLAFNFENELFKDRKVREAIGLALDMEGITRAIFPIESLAERAPGPIPRGLPGFSEAWFDEWEYSPDKAKAMLEDAGWKLGTDGIYAKDGKKLSFVLKTPNDVNRAKLGVMISTQLKTIGIDCVSQPMEWATHLNDIQSGNIEAFIMGGGSTVDGLSYMFHTKYAAGGSHNTRYVNAEMDSLIAEAMRTVDPDAREAILKTAAEIAIEERVHIPGYSEFVQIGLSKQVEGFDEIPTPWLSLTSSLRNVDKK